MNRPNGWHYDLDHIAIIKRIEALNLPKGSTILDAGAGNGILQYLLASRGYDVISLDFASRKIEANASKIFKILNCQTDNIEYKHEYMNFIKYHSGINYKFKKITLNKIINVLLRLYKYLVSEVYYLIECQKNHDSYGTIKFIRAPFHKIPMENYEVDGVVSVSAIEHADIDLFGDNIKELNRIKKKNGFFFLTTSIINSSNTFDEKTKGWCFSIEFIKQKLEIESAEYHIDDFEKDLLTNKTFLNRLDSYYYRNPESLFFNKLFKKLPYYPVLVDIK